MKSTVLNAWKHLKPSQTFMMNMLIWQFHNSSFWKEQLLTFTLTRVIFETTFFSKELLFIVLITLIFFRGTVFLGTATVKRIYLKHQIFKKAIFFFKAPLVIVHSLKKCVILFFIRSVASGHSFLNPTGFFWRIMSIHTLLHVGWLFKRSSCSHPFRQGLYETDNF